MKEGISIFFPAYNDAGSIEHLVETATSVVKNLTDNYEIIVVNDGSQDNTKKIINSLAKKYKFFKAVHHEKNKGYGGALKTAISNCTKDWIFYTDGDGQYNPRELIKLWKVRDKADIINGYKIKRGDGFYRTLIGRMYHYLAKFMFGLKVKDVDCDFRLMKRKIFDNIKLESNSGFACVEMVKKIQNKGYKFFEVPVNHYPRQSGNSQFFTPKKIIKTLLTFLKFRIRLFFE